MNRYLLLLVIVCVTFFGCGSPSGSTTDLATVYLTASPLSDRLEADVLTGNSCPTSATSGGAFTTQTIPISITSTAYPNAINKSPVTINRIIISYLPYDPNVNPPLLPVQYDTGGTILAGTQQTFDVKVAPDKLLLDLVNTYGLQLCSVDYWEYYATITFSGVENFGGMPVEISTTVKVAFADRNNK